MADGAGSTFASAANARYGYHLLNLLGSLAVNSPIFDRIVVYDLGLSDHQRQLLEGVRGVEIRQVEPFAPHWSRGFTWKPWVWTQADLGGLVFWLDAGSTILRSLAPVVEHIRERGYFVVSQGRPLREIVPSDYWELYDVPDDARDRDYVAGGIVGFRRSSDFYDQVVVPTYEHCLAGRSLGTSTPEREPDEPVRDCLHFRHDQTVFNLNLFSALRDPYVNALDEYAGWRSAHDHPRQLIWNHRRRGSMAYLARVPYARGRRLRGALFGLRYRVRWWLKLNEKYFMRSTYLLKARGLARARR